MHCLSLPFPYQLVRFPSTDYYGTNDVKGANFDYFPKYNGQDCKSIYLIQFYLFFDSENKN